jgi:hypothetical protein
MLQSIFSTEETIGQLRIDLVTTGTGLFLYPADFVFGVFRSHVYPSLLDREPPLQPLLLSLVVPAFPSVRTTPLEKNDETLYLIGLPTIFKEAWVAAKLTKKLFFLFKSIGPHVSCSVSMA